MQVSPGDEPLSGAGPGQDNRYLFSGLLTPLLFFLALELLRKGGACVLICKTISWDSITPVLSFGDQVSVFQEAVSWTGVKRPV